MQSILILGRQPALGLAEAEALFGASHLQPWGNHAVMLDIPAAGVPFGRMGGSTRVAQVIATVATTNWYDALHKAEPHVLDMVRALPEGKVRLGVSLINGSAKVSALNAAGLDVKKKVKATGRSVRIVPNTAPELNTAQVLHNQLTGHTGIELLLVAAQGKTVVARTLAVQDINAYAARDQKRPKRDARVGMLPPKLAQIIINLAGAQTPPSHTIDILDPFCGTGVVLQEALLMGFSAYGSDIDQRMVDYSIANINEWLLATKYPDLPGTSSIALGDATRHTWRTDVWNESKQDFDWHPLDITHVAGETYLGRPLSSLPRPDKLAEIIADCDTIHRKFLANLARQTKPGTRVCLAVPAWKTPSGFKHLKTLASLPELGYNRIRFVHVDTADLVYHRPDQLVARELVVLERK